MVAKQSAAVMVIGAGVASTAKSGEPSCVTEPGGDGDDYAKGSGLAGRRRGSPGASEGKKNNCLFLSFFFGCEQESN